MRNLPDSVKACLEGYSSTGDNLRTSSQAEVYFFRRAERRGRYLKIRHTVDGPGEANLEAEKIALQWLQGKIWVPELIHYSCEEGREYLVTSEIPGYSSENDRFKTDIPGLLRLLAHALKRIHSLPVNDCPVDCSVHSLLVKLEHRIDQGILKSEDLTNVGWHGRPQEFLDVMHAMRPQPEEVVVTHGDYCLPNILVQDGQVMGVIDWGYFGLGDWYRDFAAIVKSICRNLGEEWVDLFFQEYGIGELDHEKMKFHHMLSELT